MKKTMMALLLCLQPLTNIHAIATHIPEEYAYCQYSTEMASELYEMRSSGASKEEMMQLVNEQANSLRSENRLNPDQLKSTYHIVNTLYSNKVDLKTLGTKKDKQMFLYTVYALCVDGEI